MRGLGRTLVIATAVLAGGAVAAQAADPAPKTPAERRQAMQERRQAAQARRAQGWEHFLVTFDANKDGKVSKDELLAKNPGFDLLDRNHDGSVTKEEVDSFPAAQQHPGMSGWVDRFDADHDGKVSLDEWNQKRTRTFDQADKNKDGFIEKDEFVGGGRGLSGM